MRDYGKVAPSFWIGATGKALRGDANAQLLALYLMTSPHSNMIGVFHCPVLYMAHETGITFEGASEALRRLVEVGFCTYEGESETVFVHRMAASRRGQCHTFEGAGLSGHTAQRDPEALRRDFPSSPLPPAEKSPFPFCQRL